MPPVATASTRARRALADLARELSPREPQLSVAIRAAIRFGEPCEPRRLLDHWCARAPGPSVGDDRYRWELTHARGTGIPHYAGSPDTWQAWHRSEQATLERDVHAFEARLTTPIILCESAELLAELDGETARTLLSECEPILRRDFAAYIQGRHAWGDTFALWVLTHYPKTFERLHPIAMALAETYAAIASESEGLVLGSRFPFHEKPLVSGSAHLAISLLRLGLHLNVVAAAFRFVSQARRDSGGFGDVDDPEDLLTTLAAAEFLARTDPEFDIERTQRYFLGAQEPSGLFKATGPEAPWLTVAIERWLNTTETPFANRFEWPHLHSANLDKKTGLPFFAYFADLAELFSELAGLSQTHTQLAFIDLAGFRAFNNRFGQDVGDQVLAHFAQVLRELPGARVVRDGGDEFLVVGAPTRSGLTQDLEQLRQDWPRRFHGRFGREVAPVAPRILVSTVRANGLMRAREALGRAVSPLKKRAPTPSAEGVLEVLELE